MATVSRRRRKQADGSHKEEGWQVRYVDADGTQRKRKFDAYRDAKEFAGIVEVRKARGTLTPARSGTMTFRDYAEGWRQTLIHSPATARNLEAKLRLHVYPTIGDMAMRDIRQRHLRLIVKDKLDSGALARSTLAVLMRELSGLFRAAVDDDVIGKSPGIVVDDADPAEAEPFTDTECEALIAAMPERWQLAAELALGAGLRAGELLALRVSAVDFLRFTVRVDAKQGQVQTVAGQGVVLRPPKNKAGRLIPVDERLVGLVGEHVSRWPHPDGHLFALPHGGLVYSTAFYAVWSAAVAAAGMPPGTRFHRFRHTYASDLLANGASVKALQKALGHRSATITLDRYGHLMPQDDGRMRAALGASRERRGATDRPKRRPNGAL